jgi:hypothetical protein
VAFKLERIMPRKKNTRNAPKATRRCRTCGRSWVPRYALAEACCAACSRAHAALVTLARELAPESRDVWTAHVLEAGRGAWRTFQQRRAQCR